MPLRPSFSVEGRRWSINMHQFELAGKATSKEPGLKFLTWFQEVQRHTRGHRRVRGKQRHNSKSPPPHSISVLGCESHTKTWGKIWKLDSDGKQHLKSIVLRSKAQTSFPLVSQLKPNIWELEKRMAEFPIDTLYLRVGQCPLRTKTNSRRGQYGGLENGVHHSKQGPLWCH
jgi:hypothetical protein